MRRGREIENRKRVKKENTTIWRAAMEQMKRKRQRRHRGNREDERDTTVEAR